jgi:hypothetical protein
LSSTEQMEILEDSCQATSTVSDHKKQEEMGCHQHIEILLLCGVALLLCGVTLLLCGVTLLLCGVALLLCGVALLLCGVALLLCGVALLLCGLSPSLSSSSDLAETCGGSLLRVCWEGPDPPSLPPSLPLNEEEKEGGQADHGNEC